MEGGGGTGKDRSFGKVRGWGKGEGLGNLKVGWGKEEIPEVGGEWV